MRRSGGPAGMVGGRRVARDEAFVDWCIELLSPLGAVRAKAMFGGHGLYVDELFVGLIADQQLFLKADPVTAPRFAAAGSGPFVFTFKGRSITMSFWRAPAEAMDSAAAMAPWGRLAMQAARAARTGKSGKTEKTEETGKGPVARATRKAQQAARAGPIGQATPKRGGRSRP